MEALFTALSNAMSGSPWLALLAAAGWGMASLLLSPCHLSSIPLVVGFVSSRREASGGAVLAYSVLFALGILLSIAAIGGVTVAAGRMMGDVGPWTNYAVAVVLALVGLFLMGIVRMPWDGGAALPRLHGHFAALLLGLIFGTAVGPCTFAYLAPVLGLAFSVAKEAPGYAMLLLLAYGIGHCALIVVAGVSAGRVQKVLDWNGSSRASVWIKRTCGVLVLAGAGWLVYTA
jgi:cytochrome c-type biogenesis protein